MGLDKPGNSGRIKKRMYSMMISTHAAKLTRPGIIYAVNHDALLLYISLNGEDNVVPSLYHYLDESDRNAVIYHNKDDIEPHASSIKKRIEALKKLHQEGIHTYLFMSPIFPKLSECTNIIDAVSPFVDYVCFENLNLRGAYLPRVMTFIQENYPEYEELFKMIYWNKNMAYWEELKKELEDYCSMKEIEHRFYFYHDQMKKK